VRGQDRNGNMTGFDDPPFSVNIHPVHQRRKIPDEELSGLPGSFHTLKEKPNLLIFALINMPFR
jgi:hypothetical protein